MIETKAHTGREFTNSPSDSRLSKTFFMPFLGGLTLLSTLPACFCGCTGAADPVCLSGTFLQAETKAAEEMPETECLDVFAFRDDRRQRLDCYQRFDSMDEWEDYIVSGSGGRIITAIANFPRTGRDWRFLNSRHGLGDVSIRLEDERRTCPVMSGELAVDAGTDDVSKNMILKPYTGEVAVNSISCDFTGKPYAGEKLSEVRIYLINVNASCSLLEDETAAPGRIINSGGLCREDMDGFLEPELLVREVEGEIGIHAVRPEVRLRCYRSNHPEETPGTPYTRLVIEGKISGRKYYWPINVNRDTDQEAGIWRGRRYSYDIRITRKGSTDPDRPVMAEDIVINKEIAQWKEKEEYSVSF